MKRSLLPRIFMTLAGMLIGSLLLLPAAWALDASPTSLTFQAVQGGANPTSKTVKIYKSSSRKISWTGKDSAGWLSLSPTSGTMGSSTQIVVSVNINGLAAGTYTGKVTITTSRGSTVAIPVTLKLAAATSSTSSGATANLAWNANSETDLAGYKVYWGTSSGRYGSPVDVGKATSYLFSNLKVGSTYYFAVTAYDQSGNE
ncbi:hypothetical protein FBQ96_05245, partial [Nitrospirales bacterium NOB]|nr:hypothetical protein [Nitrospirales bacterium NOB]